MTKIDFAQYIRELATNLFRSYGIKTNDINLKIDVNNNIFLDVDTAIPCGLIINELVSNSLKYAFSEGEKGEIAIICYPIEEHNLVLIVRDNGVGLPADLDIKNTNSLGLKLVNGLVTQLKGNINLNSSSGTEFKIVFTGVKIER